MRAILQKRWFLLCLMVLIPVGLLTGRSLNPKVITTGTAFLNSSVITAIVLFLMSFTLDSRHFRAALRAPGPILLAVGVTFGIVPLLGLVGMRFQLIEDFSVGLMIAASVPCTLAAVSVWTRKGGGNDAVSLMVTLVTNSLCFLVTPLWLNWAAATSVQLDLKQMVIGLILSVLIPSLLGQSLRLIPRLAAFATEQKTPIGVVAQVLILSLILASACKGGMRLNANGGGPGWDAVGLVWVSCVAIHLIAMLIGYHGGKLLGFSEPDLVAVTFAASQKTMPIGVLLAGYFENQGLVFAVFPMLMFHASQLFIDTAVADWFVRKHTKPAEQPS